MALRLKTVALLCFMTTGAYAYRHGIAPTLTLNSIQVTINNVNQNVLYVPGNSAAGTTVGTIVVNETGGIFDGQLSLTGINASKFKITGSLLQTATVVAPGSYAFSIIATSPGVVGSPLSQSESLYATAQYYISPSGNDSNSGLSTSSPWLSPSHSIKCGDVITAVSGTYSAANFTMGVWGTVTCSGNDNVAWISCAAFDTCVVSGNSRPASDGSMHMSASYWGIQGWEFDSNITAACVDVVPPTNTANVHHIAITNNVMNVCGQNGISIEEYLGGTGPTAVDYLVVAGNLVYNAAGQSDECYSGISFAGSANQGNVPDTHIYAAYNISWANVDGSNCAGTNVTTDGQGIIVDRPDVNSYNGRMVIENNLLIGNGGHGFELFDLQIPPVASAVLNLLYRNNTAAHNLTDPLHFGTDTSEMIFTANQPFSLVNANVIVTNNIAASNQVTCCLGTSPVYSTLESAFNNQSYVDFNWLYGLGSPNQNILNFNTGYRCFEGLNVSAPVFGVGSFNLQSCAGNILSTDPVFANATIPGAPSCSGKTDTQNCMGTTIAGFTPTAPGSNAYGFTVVAPTDSNNTNPFICNVMRTLPSSINKHC